MNPWHEYVGPLSAEDEAVDKKSPDQDQKDGDDGPKDPSTRSGNVSPPA